MIEKQVEQARRFVTKKKVIQNSRKLHEMLVLNNYEKKLQEIEE